MVGRDDDGAKRGERIPRVRSTAVLLSGRRERPWPAYLRFRTGPDEEPFSGFCSITRHR